MFGIINSVLFNLSCVKLKTEGGNEVTFGVEYIIMPVGRDGWLGTLHQSCLGLLHADGRM